MKYALCLALSVFLCTMNYSYAQTESIIKVQPVKITPVINQQLFLHSRIQHKQEPGVSAHRSGMALVILGPIKMAVGLAATGYCVAGALTGNVSGFAVVLSGVLGGFHLLTGAGVTTAGVLLLKKSKRQREQNSTRVYLSLPDLKVSSQNGTTGLGMHTTLTF